MVGIRTSQMYNAMQYQRSLVMQNMVNVLYDKTDDAQEGVLSMMLVRGGCVDLAAQSHALQGAMRAGFCVAGVCATRAH